MYKVICDGCKKEFPREKVTVCYWDDESCLCDNCMEEIEAQEMIRFENTSENTLDSGGQS